MAEYKQYISTQEFNARPEQSLFNPAIPSKDTSTYQNQQKIADQLITFGRNVGSVGQAVRYRMEEQEELNTLAENKIDRENLIQAEVEGRTLAASGKEWNETTANNILNRSIQYRKKNPALIAKMNRGFQLKTGEMTVSETNSHIKSASEEAINTLGLAWRKQQEEATLVRGNTYGENIQTFPEFVAEHIDNEASIKTQELLKDNELIAEVLAKEGRRLNYDPWMAEAAKWNKDFKDREKEEAINWSLTRHDWSNTNGKQVRDIIRSRLMSTHSIDRNRADLEIIGYLKGELTRRLAKASAPSNALEKLQLEKDLIEDNLFKSIPEILSYSPAGGVSLLDAGGKYSVGTKAHELLKLSADTYKKLFDAREASLTNDKNSAKADKKLRTQGMFSKFYTNIQARIIDKDLTLNSLAKIQTDVLDKVREGTETGKDYINTNITIHGTLGGKNSTDLLKLIADKREKLIAAQTEDDKPRVLSPTERETFTKVSKELATIENNISTLTSPKLNSDDLNKFTRELSKVQTLYDNLIGGTKDNREGMLGAVENKLGTDWKGYLPFLDKWSGVKIKLNKAKAELRAKLAESDKKDNVLTKTKGNYEIMETLKVKNQNLLVNRTKLIHNNIEEYLQASPNDRDETKFENIIHILTQKVFTREIKEDGIHLTEPKEIFLFDNGLQNKFRALIEAERFKTKEAVKAASEKKTIYTDGEEFNRISNKIDSLGKWSPNEVWKEMSKKNNQIDAIYEDISTQLLNEKMTIPNYNHLKTQLDQLSTTVKGTLDKTYGSKPVFDRASKKLRVSITGQVEDGIVTPLSASKSLLLNKVNEDLDRFRENLNSEYPDVFGNPTIDNHPIRRAIYSAYVDWLQGVDTEKIMKWHLSIRKDIGEDKQRFTDTEIKMFKESIPGSTSPHKEIFEDLSIDIGGDDEDDDDDETITTSDDNKKTITKKKKKQDEPSLRFIAGELRRGKKLGANWTRKQVIDAFKQGKALALEMKGDYSYGTVLYPFDQVDINYSTTDKSLGF